MTQKSRILFALALALTIVLRRFNETLSGFVSLSFVGAVLTFPGLWILIIWQGARASEGLRPFWIPSLSIFFLLFVYLLVDVVPYRVFGWDPPAGFPLAIAATLAACLFWRVQALGLNNETEKIYRSVRAPLFIYLTVVLACYLVVTLGVQPFSEMDYGTISARRTFFSIRTHDNYFQFINGIAISTHRPFEDFYRNGRLVYNYVDREMFPGVLYATINYIVRGFSFQWRNAFVIYEQMTIWLGALIVFPLYTLAQRFFPRVNPRTLLAVLFCNQFILVNTYFAWFKMPGAAFFLMGLCLVLSTPTAIQSWLGAGVLWGLAANFHASAALAYPFAILYLLWTYRGQLSARFCFFAFSGLSGFFGLLYLPWTLVKKVFYSEPYTMIRQAFMEGYMVPGETSLLKIYLKFLQSMSFRDHLHLRRLQLVRIFKDVEMLKLWNHLRAGEIKQYIWYRSFLEIDFPVFLFLGQFVFLALTCAYLLVAHARRRHIETPSFPPFKGESYGWAKVSLFTFLFLCVAEYSHHEPDCLFHLPLGIVFLALMFLAGTYLSWSPRVARAYQFFMGIAALRAAIAFVLVLRGAVSYSEP